MIANSQGLDSESLVRKTFRSLSTYNSSRPIQDPERLIRLDMNESPHGPSPKARAALAEFTDTHRYPDFGQSRLREALSRYTGVPVDQIVAGAGLDDVLTTLAHLILDPGDEVIISEPTFGVYRVIISMQAAVPVDVPLTKDFQLDPDAILNAVGPRTKFIIICSPNNPTGNLLDLASIERIAANVGCLVGIDEAYSEFAGTTHIPLMDRHPNVAVFRTMSKFAGLAGMRVGYGLFPKGLVPYLSHVAPAFHNVSTASAAAAIGSLDDLEYLQTVVQRINADREFLAAQLHELPGVSPFPSATNFLLVKLPVDDAEPVVAELRNRGVVVRHFGNPSLGLRDCLRVSVGTTEENEIFVDTLAAILEERSQT